MATTIGSITYCSWGPKPWKANRADGAFVGMFASTADAHAAIATVSNGYSTLVQDVRHDGTVSYTVVAP
jgi:hypothetical protein